uniref:Uncharacterized protein n=1 Tax=Kalanchoe fedtschenkoi TaxID=63787 RepID=A0A7N0RDJ5_KALFE
MRQLKELFVGDANITASSSFSYIQVLSAFLAFCLISAALIFSCAEGATGDDKDKDHGAVDYSAAYANCAAACGAACGA